MSLELSAEVPERGVRVEIHVPDGRTVALIGPNGAGKSTALSLIAGTLRPARGRVVLDGTVLTDERTWVPVHHRRVTTLSQDPVLFPHLTVRDNVRFPLRAQGVPRRRAQQETTRWLEELDLQHLAERRPSQLSGGQAQRVAIARALAADPRLILLDEPMAALDIDVAPALREQLRGFLAGRTAVIVTHDVLDALTLADHVIVLEQGRVVEEGPTTEVLARPRSAFAARFAGLNLITGALEDGALQLPGGGHLPVRSDAAPGTTLHAAFRPGSVHLVDEDAQAGLPRTVRTLSPHGDLVRVRTEDLAADLAPQDVAARHLEPGSRVCLAVSREDVTAYGA